MADFDGFVTEAFTLIHCHIHEAKFTTLERSARTATHERFLKFLVDFDALGVVVDDVVEVEVVF